MSIDTNDAKTKTCFRPPAGGDVVVRSSDGHEFHVHSVILSIASSVFRDMLIVGSPGTNNTIDLTEDARAISFMLDFIYPVDDTPQIPDVATLQSCLEIARKYDLGAMLKNIDTQLCRSEDPLLCSSPEVPQLCSSASDMYRIAVDYNLPNSRESAARRLLNGPYNLLKPTRLAEFIDSIDSNKASIALAGVQGVRLKILNDVFMDLNTPHMRKLADTAYGDLSCRPCREMFSSIRSASLRRPPGWALQWSHATHRALTKAPLDKCLPYFDAAIFDSFNTMDGIGCSNCLDQFWQQVATRDVFNEWAGIVKATLQERLETLEPLYKLC